VTLIGVGLAGSALAMMAKVSAINKNDIFFMATAAGET
jgi:hypothetical protein